MPGSTIKPIMAAAFLSDPAVGAGRLRVEDPVDLAVGIYLDKKIGDRVVKGDVLCRIHWNDEQRLTHAVRLIEEAYEIQNKPSRRRPLIHAVLKGQK